MRVLPPRVLGGLKRGELVGGSGPVSYTEPLVRRFVYSLRFVNGREWGVSFTLDGMSTPIIWAAAAIDPGWPGLTPSKARVVARATLRAGLLVPDLAEVELAHGRWVDGAGEVRCICDHVLRRSTHPKWWDTTDLELDTLLATHRAEKVRAHVLRRTP